jgi:putative spermidine/putrescine transport system permease protein
MVLLDGGEQMLAIVRLASVLLAVVAISRGARADLALETETARVLPAGQATAGSAFEFQTSPNGTEYAVPLAFEFGVVKDFELMIEPVAFTAILPIPFGHQLPALGLVLIGLGLIEQRITLMPSTGAITIGLAHALLPYAVLTIMGGLDAIPPSLERAAMSLGAGRLRTFLHVVLPLSLPGVAGGFILCFAIAISAYGMPQDISRSKEAGFADYLQKPVNIQTLDAAVAKALSRASAEQLGEHAVP